MPPFRPSLPRPQLLLVVVVLAASLFGLREYYIMLSVQKTSVAALLSATTVIGASVDLGWYAPSGSKINNLTSALESDGIYGFIYDSSQTPNNKYGTYNWCNMPHARKREYVKASGDYELKYVEVIQRHHKRTPYASNAFPVESYQWNCDDQGLYYFGRPFTKNGKSAAESYWQGFTGEINPFVPAGWIGSCQFPQITAAGLDDSWTHGKDLYEVYHDLLDFLPARNKNWRKKVMFRVTNNQITSQVAGMFINGMWGTTDSIPLAIQASGVDSLEPQYTCSVGSNLFSQIKSSSNSQWQQHLTKSSELFKTLDNISGVPSTDSGFHASFDHYYDNASSLSARQCHGKPLPCKLVDGKNSSTCVDQKLANAVYRMGQWEYSQMYRDASASLAASSTAYGVWIAELASHLRAVIKGESKTIYFHNFAHDGSTSRVLSILQIDEMVWPGMGSEIVFELYQKKKNVPKNTSGYHVRVLFGGQTLKSSSPTLGLMEMVPVETLLGYFDGLVGENASLVKGKCSGSISV